MSINVYHGENTYESTQTLTRALEKFGQSLDSAEIVVLDGQILTNAFSFDTNSLWSQRRIYLIKRIFQSEEPIRSQIIRNILKYPSLDVYIWEDKLIPRVSKLNKEFLAKSVEHRFDHLKPQAFASWLHAKCTEAKIHDPKIIELLSSIEKQDQWRVSGEIQKLVDYSQATRLHIQYEDAVEVIGDVPTGMWEILDLILKKDRVHAIDKVITTNFETDAQIGVVSALAYQIKTLILLRAFPLMPQQELSSRMGIHPFVLSKLRRCENNFQIESLKRMFQQLVNIEYMLKQGQINFKLALALFIASS